MPFASSARKQGAANTPNKPIPGAPWNEQRPRVQATPFEPTPDTSPEPSGNAADPASPPPPLPAAPVARAQRPPRPKPPGATLPSVVPAVPPRVATRMPKSPPPSAAMRQSQAAGVAASPPAAAPRPLGATKPSPTLPAVGVLPTKPATVAGSKMASAPAATDVAARLAELEQRRIELAQRAE